MNGKLTVYKASAGSGKTFTLTAEYISLLLSGEPQGHRHILAVTFTNKATAEMKERILQTLWAIAHLSPEERAHDAAFCAVAERLPEVAPDELARRAAAALTAVIHDYDNFRVETIDSFFQSLLTCLAHELGLSSGFRVDINDHDVIDRAVEALMTDLPYRPEVLSWVLAYIRERIEDNKRWDITREVKELAHHLMTEKFLTYDSRVMAALDAPEYVADYRRELREMERTAADHLISAARELSEEISRRVGDITVFSRGATIGTYLRHIIDGEPTAPTPTVEGYMKDVRLWVKKADAKRDDLFAAAEEFRPALQQLETMRKQAADTINSCRLSLRHLSPLRLFGEINREVDRINHDTGRFMLAKTPLLFNRLVDGADASFVFERAGTTFRHVMIDEFQDTSTLQWRNFKNLLVENMSQANDCLLVGDVKQSIYRFRGGDWGILSGIEHEFAGWKPQVKDLTVNFRSASTIIDFNNALFTAAAEQLDLSGRTDTICPLYADVRQTASNTAEGYVEVHLTPRSTQAEKAEAEATDDGIAARLAETIVDLHHNGVKYEDIAILVRFNRETPAILSYFAAQYPDIPVVSDEAFLLQSSPAVQLLVGAMRYLVDGSDTINLARVAYDYQQRILHADPLWDDVALRSRDFLPDEYVNERDTLPHLPLYEMTLRLMTMFRPECIKGSGPYLYAFLDGVLAFLDDNASDVRRFLTHWDETLCRKAISAGEVQGVRILTIHKSKGLAFHTVLMPHVDWNIEQGPRGDMLWCEPGETPYNKMPLLPIPAAGERILTESIYAKDYAEEYLQRRIENLNLTYVAFTRAKQNLYIWAETKYLHHDTEKEKKNRKKGEEEKVKTIGDLLYKCLADSGEKDDEYLSYRSGHPGPGASGKHTTRAANPLEAHPETLWVEPAARGSRAAYRQSGEARRFLSDEESEEETRRADYISRGKLMHYIFERIRTDNDIEKVITELEASGLIGNEREASSLRHLVTKRLSDERVAPWFDGSWRLYNECTILSRDASTGMVITHRPDRVMIRDGHVVVVDFKFGKPHNEHFDQVRGYVELLHRMGHRNVRGYLWYVYSGQVAEVE